jgi:hypothetical protein
MSDISDMVDEYKKVTRALATLGEQVADLTRKIDRVLAYTETEEERHKRKQEVIDKMLQGYVVPDHRAYPVNDGPDQGTVLTLRSDPHGPCDEANCIDCDPDWDVAR